MNANFMSRTDPAAPTMRFRCPWNAVKRPAVRKKPSVAPGPTAASAETRPSRPEVPLNILLVEDHEDTRASIQRLLEAAAHRVTAAGSAEDALKLADTMAFDLVISDLGLPDRSGNELMRQLRARTEVPGIALSGYGMENDIEESRKSGFKYHVTKPVSFERLKSVVAEVAASRQNS